MALNDITINRGQGGLGRPLEGTDYVSGLLFYSGSLPSGMSSSDRIKVVYSVEDAEGYGITDLHVGETKAVAKVAIAGTPAAGDTVTITYAGIDGTVTVLPTYTLTSGDAVSATTAAAALAVAINLLTITTGFSATSAVGDLLITTKGGEGVFPNSGTPYVATKTGTLTATVTQPTGSGSTVLGVASDIDILHYHISEYFRLQPKGKLYVDVEATADFGTFAKITTLQNYAQGEINLLGVYQKHTAFATSQCNGIQSVCTTLETAHKPIASVILSGEISGTADITTFTTNLHTLSDSNVSVTIAQDGAATGYHLFKATGKSITNLGEVLGCVALASVHESIAHLGKFQVASTELDTLAFANGQAYSALSDGTITALDTQGFLILRKVVDLTGSFHNRPYTCVSITNDYAFIYSNRVMTKATKNMRATVLPAVGSSVTTNSDGTLSLDSLNYFKTLTQQGLNNLLRNGEISNYSVDIDSTQDILSTGTLEISARIQPKGVADFITINVAFTTSI